MWMNGLMMKIGCILSGRIIRSLKRLNGRIRKASYCSVCSFDNKEVCSLFLEEEEYDYDEDEEEYPEDEDY
jgi:hypothetical protein